MKQLQRLPYGTSIDNDKTENTNKIKVFRQSANENYIKTRLTFQG